MTESWPYRQRSNKLWFSSYGSGQTNGQTDILIAILCTLHGYEYKASHSFSCNRWWDEVYNDEIMFETGRRSCCGHYMWLTTVSYCSKFIRYRPIYMYVTQAPCNLYQTISPTNKHNKHNRRNVDLRYNYGQRQGHQRFLPRDALLSAVYAVVVCLSVCLCVCVCHTPVLYQNG